MSKSWKNLSIVNKAVIPLVVLFIIIGFLSYFAMDKMTTALINDMLLQNIQSKINDVGSNIRRMSNTALENASFLSNLEEVRKIYQIKDENEARDTMRAFFTPVAEKIKKDTGSSAVKVHFHKPPARSLLRTWRKKGEKDGGDDLSSFRATILQVSKTHKPVIGIEVGRGGFVVRGLSPIFDGNSYVGSVEMFYDFQPVIDYSISGEGQDFALFMNEELLSIATRLKESPRVGAYVLATATNRQLSDQFVIEADIKKGTTGLFYKRFPGKIVSFFPITDYNKKQIGVMTYIQDTTKQNKMLDGIKRNFLLGVAGVMLLLLCIISFFLHRIIIRPVVMAMTVAEKIRQGDLSQRLGWDRGDEIGCLARSFDEMTESLNAKCELTKNIVKGDLTRGVIPVSEEDSLGNSLKQMVTSLNDVVGRMLDAANRVTLGSGEIADAAHSLSQGATQQASSLEEISTSVNQVGSQAKTNAENASQANQLVLEVKKAAENGDARMKEMIEAMGSINDSSSEISKIIKEIDDIAFQTNLLALNAAVEAARAGKHGKGFSVVAGEVRNLAQRSAGAAQKTAGLIDASVSKVEKGSQIMDKTAQALREIVEGVAKVTDIVSKIASASNEQAQGVEQISHSMIQIEQVTHQNTALAEQTAASVSTLSSQAEEMRQAIAYFKLKKEARAKTETEKPPIRRGLEAESSSLLEE